MSYSQYSARGSDYYYSSYSAPTTASSYASYQDSSYRGTPVAQVPGDETPLTSQPMAAAFMCFGGGGYGHPQQFGTPPGLPTPFVSGNSLQASVGDYGAPIVLVEALRNDDKAAPSNERFRVTPEGEAFLRELETRKIKAIGIVGSARTGKSFLMNQFLDQSYTRGFVVGHTCASQTKGIWMWAEQDPSDSESVFLYLDSEGVFDPGNDIDFDLQVLVLMVLSTSFLMYNTLGVINKAMLDQLGLVANVAKNVQIGLPSVAVPTAIPSPYQDRGRGGRGSEPPQASEEHYQHFPHLKVVVRNFQFEYGSGPQNAIEYLQAALLPFESPANEREATLNRNGEAILQVFPEISCTTLPSPVSHEYLGELDTLPSTILFPDFVQQCQQLIEDVKVAVKPKSLSFQGYSIPLTASSYVEMLKSYVHKINSGGVPVLCSTFELISQHQLREGLDICTRNYEEAIKQLQLPQEAPQLTQTLEQIKPQFLDQLMEIVVGDGKRVAAVTFLSATVTIDEAAHNNNLGASVDYCTNIANNLATTLAASCDYQHYRRIEDFDREAKRVLDDFQRSGIGPGRDSVAEYLFKRLSELARILEGQLGIVAREAQAREAARNAQANSIRAQQQARERQQRGQQEQAHREQARRSFEIAVQRIHEEQNAMRQRAAEERQRHQEVIRSIQNETNARMLQMQMQQEASRRASVEADYQRRREAYTRYYKQSSATETFFISLAKECVNELISSFTGIPIPIL